MSLMCRELSDKGKTQNFISKRLKTSDKNHFSANRSTSDCKCLNHSKMDGQHKMKRLRSRKERSHMRGCWKETSKSRSHHHHHRCQTSIDMMHFHNCCHHPSRREAALQNVVHAAQEPSIITDSRLLGHQGLFNHEVKSIDIERLLNDQQTLEKNGEQMQEKSTATSNPSTSNIHPLSTNHLLGDRTDELIQFRNKEDPTPKTSDDCPQREDKISQGSDLTPGQRSKQQPDPSTDSFKSVSSSKQLTPTVDREDVMVKGHMISALEHTPKNQKSSVHQTPAHDRNPSPVQLSSSPTADSIDIQHKRQNPDSVFQSVSAVAARLCDCLQFPLKRRRGLVAESREVLLKALQERHGPQLQENLLKVQQSLSIGIDPIRVVEDQRPTMRNEDYPLHTDAFTTTFQADDDVSEITCFDNQKATSFKLTGSKQFHWKSNPQLHHNLKQTSEWFRSPVETSDRLLDDILRPHSPQFCMDFEATGISASGHFFGPSPTSCWGEKASESQYWEDRFNRLTSKDTVVFGSFEDNFMNHTRAVTERSSGSQYSDSNIQPFFPYRAQLPDSRSMHFPQEQDPFEADRYSFAPSLPAQMYQPQHHQPFSQFSHPSTYRPLRSHHTDMMHYPPSHMLERDMAPPLSSLQSPEHWSFPPMRLY